MGQEAGTKTIPGCKAAAVEPPRSAAGRHMNR